jgi:hypothetical protein
MDYLEQTKENTYVLYAPPPTDSSILPSIYWIEVRNDQNVEWQWLELPDGNQVVTNYKIIEKNSF